MHREERQTATHHLPRAFVGTRPAHSRGSTENKSKDNYATKLTTFAHGPAATLNFVRSGSSLLQRVIYITWNLNKNCMVDGAPVLNMESNFVQRQQRHFLKCRRSKKNQLLSMVLSQMASNAGRLATCGGCKRARKTASPQRQQNRRKLRFVGRRKWRSKSRLRETAICFVKFDQFSSLLSRRCRGESPGLQDLPFCSRGLQQRHAKRRRMFQKSG
ncbi:hypothetical protein L596_015070 [Steinernema carpocapsae]|uniref:Uncharacterized protein n=1 Tax=Steinernema carpocapsae TaxID=34508 RepID=A0A4U5NER2_STECR|nr:hypothetical protein L596_015070 [Steinernema carpocapsae]